MEAEKKYYINKPSTLNHIINPLSAWGKKAKRFFLKDKVQAWILTRFEHK